MFKSNLKIAWRNLQSNKLYSFINIAGLATGMAVALLIGLWLWDEISFDHYHINHNRIAQVMVTETVNGDRNTGEATAIPLAEELKNKYGADFKRVAIVFPNFTHTLAYGDKKLSQSGEWVQPDLPEMLTLNMLYGKRDALKDPSSVLLTQSVAKALFGEEDPMNKMLKLDNMTTVRVGGVFEDLPENTSFHDTKLFLAWDKSLSVMSWLRDAQTEWDNRIFKLYVQLNDGVDIDRAGAKIKNITGNHVKAANETVSLHPMNKWHLYSEFKNGFAAGGRIRYVWMFGMIGLFVLLLACINFMNLSTARSEKRAREVGIRKAIGSMRSQLIGQFLSESLLVSLLACIAALAIVKLVLPLFNLLTEKQISIPFSNPLLWIMILGFALFTGLVSGSYPAFYLSAFRPVKVLKGSFRLGRFASAPRKLLVVVQFSVSISLIIGTVIVYRQIQYAKNRPVGYSREGLITVTMNTPEIYGASYSALRNELLQTGVVSDMAKSSIRSTETPADNNDFSWEGKDPNVTAALGIVGVTYDFGHTIGWQIKEGRDFSRSFLSDSGALILNEAAVKLTGFRNPVGHSIRWEGRDHRITGVVKDMVMESPYTPVRPTVFFLQLDNWLNALTVRIRPGVAARDALAKIGLVFKKFNPESPFEYKFTDEEYARKFSDEERIGNLATVFAVLAIFISCLGLFGLASFVAEQRTREIGVRKVLGASVFNLWKMLSKDFVVLVMVSCMIAIPAAYYFLNGWLQQYEYRTMISWWIFAAAIAGALIITLLTVSYQSIKAASNNPVKSLRNN